MDKQIKGKNVLNAIYIKAWTDKKFKEELLKNPVSTLEKFFNTQFPRSKKIITSDQSDPRCIYINIPVRPDDEKMEFLKKEIERMSGIEININSAT